MKMSIPSKMNTLVNNKECLQIMLKDKTSSGNKVTMKFLESCMNCNPAIEGKDYRCCPILLTQPEKDRWTPKYLSDLFLDEIKDVPLIKLSYQKGRIIRLKKMHLWYCAKRLIISYLTH